MCNFKKIEQEKILCTAGVDYCYISSDNLVYNCLAQSGDPSNAICNLKDYKKIFTHNEKVLECKDFCCYSGCDGIQVDAWKNDEKLYSVKYWRKPLEKIEDMDSSLCRIVSGPVLGCYNNCPYCVRAYNNVKKSEVKQVNPVQYVKFLEHVASIKHGCKTVQLCGPGEPLIHDYIVDIINAAIELDYYVDLITSGLIFEEKIFEIDCFEKLILAISLHPSSQNWSERKIHKILEFAKTKNIHHLQLNYVTGYELNDKLLHHMKNIASEYDVPLHEIENNHLGD